MVRGTACHRWWGKDVSIRTGITSECIEESAGVWGVACYTMPWQVCEGAYRGAGDTLTPLPITFLIAIVNLILDPILMFTYKMHLSGAALATVIAQYVGMFAYMALMFSGTSRSPITREEAPPEAVRVKPTLKSVVEDAGHLLPLLGEILSANINMLIRHSTLLATWAVATAVATGIGTYEVAAHQVGGVG